MQELIDCLKKVPNGTKVNILFGIFSTDVATGDFSIESDKLEILRQSLLKNFINRYTKDKCTVYQYRDMILEIREDKTQLYFNKNTPICLLSNCVVETVNQEVVAELEKFPSRDKYYLITTRNIKKFNYHAVDVFLIEDVSDNKKISYVTVVFEKTPELPTELIKVIKLISTTVF